MFSGMSTNDGSCSKRLCGLRCQPAPWKCRRANEMQIAEDIQPVAFRGLLGPVQTGLTLRWIRISRESCFHLFPKDWKSK